MYHRYCLNIGSIKTQQEIEAAVKKVLAERFNDNIIFISNGIRTYHFYCEPATHSVGFSTHQIFEFTMLSGLKLDFPEQPNYLREYLRDAFMNDLGVALGAKAYNYNERRSYDPNPDNSKNFLHYLKNRFSDKPKLLRAAKAEYIKTISGSPELRELYSKIEGGHSALI